MKKKVKSIKQVKDFAKVKTLDKKMAAKLKGGDVRKDSHDESEIQ